MLPRTSFHPLKTVDLAVICKHSISSILYDGILIAYFDQRLVLQRYFLRKGLVPQLYILCKKLTNFITYLYIVLKITLVMLFIEIKISPTVFSSKFILINIILYLLIFCIYVTPFK